MRCSTKCLIALLVASILIGCGATRYSSPGWGQQEDHDCPKIYVDNPQFDRVVVRLASMNRRLGAVEGHTQRVFVKCYLVGRSPDFTIDPLGAPEPYPVQGFSVMDYGTEIWIVIGRTPGLTRITGT